MYIRISQSHCVLYHILYIYYLFHLLPRHPNCLVDMNSIFIYVRSELMTFFPFHHFKLLSENLIAVTLWIIIAYYCYFIGFFVKI